MTLLAPSPHAPRSIAAPIERYLVVTTARIDAALADLVLREPRPHDPVIALRTTDQLVETLAGLALGSVIGAIATRVRRGFGPELRLAAERAMRAALSTIAPPQTQGLRSVDAGSMRALSTELTGRLRGRVALVPRAAGTVLTAIATSIERVEPAELGPLGRILGIVTDDELVAARYVAQVVAGWRCACAAIEHRPFVAPEPLWRQWSSALDHGAMRVQDDLDAPVRRLVRA